MIRLSHGALIEYSLAFPPLMLTFEFNPESLSRSRTLTLKTGAAQQVRGGYDFTSPLEAGRAAQGVTVNNESLSLTILLDATDRMDAGDPVASRFGIQPEIDTIRTMLEPKLQTPGGVQVLASLGTGQGRAFSQDLKASVLLFLWGGHILPVFLTESSVDVSDFTPSLMPYRGKATLKLQVIESQNPFYTVEVVRQMASAALNTGTTLASAVSGLIG